MPWTVEDPPRPAINATQTQKEKCVRAANAVLEAGGTEEEAIFACLHNSGIGKGEATMDREYKSLDSFETKLDGDQGIVEHYISVFGVLDHVGDIVHPGAFKKTLAERGGKVLVLDNHKMDGKDSVLGKPISIQEVGRDQLPATMLAEYPEATGGVKAITQFAMNTQAGREAFELIKMGALQEWSFAYEPIQKDWSEVEINGRKTNIRNLRELKLYEYSTVLMGANSATMTTGVKSDDVEVDEKGVSGGSFPLAERDHGWDAGAARQRLQSWAGATDSANAKYKSAFFWNDGSDNLTGCKFPFVDIIGGTAKAVPRAIFNGAARLESADIPASDKAGIRSKMSGYYSKMRSQFGDDSLVAPWDKGAEVEAETKSLAEQMDELRAALTDISMRLEVIEAKAGPVDVGGAGSSEQTPTPDVKPPTDERKRWLKMQVDAAMSEVETMLMQHN